MWIPNGEDFMLDEQTIEDLKEKALKTLLYKNFNKFKNCQIIKIKGYSSLFYHKILSITDNWENEVIQMRNSSDRIKINLTQAQLANSKVQDGFLCVPQDVGTQDLKLQLFFLKNLLDNSS
jgi:hypothetical protein